MKVLVCAPSNVAIGRFHKTSLVMILKILLDNLVTRVKEYDQINVVRDGNLAQLNSAVVERSLDVLCFAGDRQGVLQRVRDEIEGLSIRMKTTMHLQDEKEIDTIERVLRRIFRTTAIADVKKKPDQVLDEADVVFSTFNG